MDVGDIVHATVKRVEVFGIFCECHNHEILVLIPEISWIASFKSCTQIAAIGDTLEIKIIGIDNRRNKIAGSLKALHPDNDPFGGSWNLSVGDILNASVVRWVEPADGLEDAGAYLITLRPGALAMLCCSDATEFRPGDTCEVRITAINPNRRSVAVEMAPHD